MEFERQNNKKFKNKVVVITGTSGRIGRELACQLASRGALLFLFARNNQRLSEVFSECSASEGRAIAISTDVSDPEQCSAGQTWIMVQVVIIWNRLANGS